ncbi:NPCBM/NEW2 domain-containing protein [Rugosimonospora africana]|uniref:Alpha-galactosidase n=1 Tax=Rugosimonospora africana TaxID=556532 RepID=A0A8J3VV08_9ACTN|nr:NPCBM/NEW2 domain-containing protein [Rugosimonospora africana]GIH20142.1 alpha-galactosidase [Rugosimonospora africana]
MRSSLAGAAAGITLLLGLAAAPANAAPAVAAGSPAGGSRPASVTPAATTAINDLARTPYLGWNTYYGLGSAYDEATIESETDAIVDRGLAAAGYQYVWLDGGWWSGTRDAQGNITVDSAQWPSGMKAVADYIHARGLKAGIYTDAGKDGCGGANQGSYGHYQQDVNQFAGWGFDAVKVDFCGGTNLRLAPATAYGQFRDALLANSSHRPMLFNICNPFTPGAAGDNYPPVELSVYSSYTFGPTTGNSWRTDTDAGFVHSVQWSDVLRNLDDDAKHPEAAGPGHWNDPDYLGPELGMTAAQAQAQFTMWSVLAAPLIVGSDVRSLSAATVAMLTNPDVLAVDQDRLGVQGTRVSAPGQGEVWVRPLAGGDRAVALLNRGSTPLTVTTSAAAVGLGDTARYTVDDLWAHTSTESAGTIRATVPAGSAVLYRVSAGGGQHLAPATALSAPTVPATPGWGGNLVLPGTSSTVTATFANDGRDPATGVGLTLSVPDGWTGGGSTGGGTVRANGHATSTWQVTVPAGTLPGTYPLTVTADYRWGGYQTGQRTGQVRVQVPSTPPAGAGQLSDQPWLDASSGWQVAAPDTSVGGNPITLGGTGYPKGLGVASPSTVDYYLGGNCTSLSGTVGIDDAVNNVDQQGGTATFTVSGDGRTRYDSGTVDRTAAHPFTVDLTGVRVLTLTVGDAGDGGYNDRADWAGLTLACGAVPADGWPSFVDRTGLVATATTAHDGYPAAAAVDSRLSTIWHDEFSPQAPLPQAVTIDLGRTHTVDGLTYQPRMDASTTGTITGYRIEVSADGQTFAPVSSGTWTDDRTLKSVAFAPVQGRYVRLVATAGDGGYASAAEIRVRQTQ